MRLAAWSWLIHWHIWLWAVAVLAAAWIAGLVAHAIIFWILGRLARRPGRVLEASLNRHARRPSRWLLPVVAMLLALPAAPMSDLVRGGLQHLFSLVLIAGGAWCIMLAVAVFSDLIAARYRVDVADNLAARRIATQVQVMRRVVGVIVAILALSLMLLTFPGAQAIGTSMLASAGLAGLVVGMAMRPTLSNLVAGIQIALTQPMRLEDAVIVENEWGWIEEITSTYVVVRLWDWRRMVLPLTYFIEHPFQNWTRSSSQLIGTVFLMLDFRTPLAPLREELQRLCEASPQWDRRVCVMQVTDANEQAMQIRMLVSSTDSGRNFDLRCQVREGLICYVQTHYPEALPRWRGELDRRQPEGGATDLPDDPQPQRSPSPEDGGPGRQVG